MIARSLAAAALCVAAWIPLTAVAAPCAGFIDVDDTSPFCSDVTFLKNRSITLGCTATQYCPNDPVSRLAMAAFMRRLSDALFPLNCASGQVMKWNGVAWACANDNGGAGGGVTSVTAGQGLSGGTITSAGTIAIANGGVSNAMLANDAVATANLQNGTVTLPKLSGSGCAAGQVLRFDGTAWSCGTDGSLLLRPPHDTRNHGATNTGAFSSVTVGADGRPVIAYYDQGAQDLKLARCADVACTSASVTTLDDTSSNVGEYPSIIMNSDGFMVVSYYDRANTQLKIAVCNDLACSSPTRSVVDTTNDVGQFSSVTTTGAFDSFIYAISYYDATTDDLKIAFCSSACASPNVFTIASTGTVGKWTSVASGFDAVSNFSNRVVVAYLDEQLDAVRLAFCGENLCGSPTFVTVEALGTDTADGISLAIGANGAPVLSYYRRTSPTSATRRIAVCNDPDCTSPVIRALGSGSFVEQQSGIAVPLDGLPVAVFGSPSTNCDTAGGGTLATVFKCLDAACTTSTAQFPASVGISPSITIGVDGMPFFAYGRCAASGRRLDTVHCGATHCNRVTRVR